MISAVFAVSFVLSAASTGWTQTAPVAPTAPAATPAAAPDSIEELDKFVVAAAGADVVKPPPFSGSNFDLPRGPDDIQPYYIWDDSEIDSSGATDLQDFFQKRVPMDTNRQVSMQLSTTASNTTNLSLGGLSGNNGSTSTTQNTLILLNGLPMPSAGSQGSVLQPDVNVIPMAAVERIEVLPASASAIYGANATAGVINIILKHDYSGAELSYTYNNTFGTDAPIRDVSLVAGATLEGGKTSILVVADYATSKTLELQDRTQIYQPYFAKYLSEYPGGELAYLGVTTSTGGTPTGAPSVYLSTPLIRSVNGTPLFAGSTATQVQIPSGYQSYQVNGLAPLQAAVGTYNLTNPTNADTQAPLGLRYPLNQGPEYKSIEFLVRRQMTPWLEVFAQFGNFGHSEFMPYNYAYVPNLIVPASAPGNPFNQAVYVSTGYGFASAYPYQTTDLDTITFSTGAKFNLPFEWKAEVDYTWGTTSNGYNNLASYYTESPALQDAVNAGDVNLITDLSKTPLNSDPNIFGVFQSVIEHTTLDALQFRAVGPLPKLWAGAPLLSIGAAHQMDGEVYGTYERRYPGAELYPLPVGSTLGEGVYYPGQREAHNGTYGELDLPLVSKANHIGGVRSLEFQGAVRYDAFSEYTTSPVSVETLPTYGAPDTFVPALTNGQPEPYTNNPVTKYDNVTGTVGFKYHPVDDVFFRWSFTTGFDTPAFSQLLNPISTGTVLEPATPASQVNPGVPTSSPWSYTSITDPALNSTYYVPMETGGNPALKPETSHGLDWGVVLEPKFLPGLRVSVDYTKVTKFDDIIAPSAATLIQYFPDRVQRSGPGGPIVFIDGRDINAPETYTSSYNFEIDYTWKTESFGRWKLSALANSWQHYDIQSVPGGAFVEQLGNPYVSGGINASGQSTGVGVGLAKLKANLSLDWSKGPLSAGWAVQYIGPYTEGAEYGTGGSLPYEVQTFNGWVSGQIYHDVYVGYKVGGASRLDPWWRQALAHTSLRVGVDNVFGHLPPYDGVSGYAIGFYSPYGDIRLATYILNIKKAW